MIGIIKKFLFGNETEHHSLVFTVPGKLGKARILTAMHDIRGKLSKECDYYDFNVRSLGTDKYQVNLSVTSENNDEVLRKTKSMVTEWLRKNP